MKKFAASQGMFLVVAWLLTAAPLSPAQTLTTLHSFAGQPSDGRQPYASLVQGSDGNLYGTTYFGGANNKGTAFRMSASGSVTILHSFTNSGTDGCEPEAKLIQASDGNFYGTTSFCGSGNGGTVFKITPSGTLTALHDFAPGQNDGGAPYAGLIQASDGNFYGTTTAGGTHHGNGTVFKITPNGTVTILHSFACTDGCAPYGGLVQGSDGSLYGTTREGGTGGFNYGTIFKITTGGSFTLLHTFEGNDGGEPYASMIRGTDGNFYGTTSSAGTHGAGTVFKMASDGTLTTVYNFCPGGYPCADGQEPYSAVMQASDGNFYGTTYLGGSDNVGTVFQLTPSGTLTSLVSFNGGNGAGPEAGLIQAGDGNFYGTTSTGGSSGDGTAFRMTPPPVPTATVLTSAPNPSHLGEQVTLTATVTAQNGGTPTGNVVFESDGNPIGTVALSSGVAVLTDSSLTLGTHSLVATYPPTGNYAGSTSNTVQQVVELPATTTTVTSSLNPSTVGQQVTFTATVAPAGPPQPTGTVSFTSNGAAIPGCTSVTLSNLTALCVTSTLPTGTDIVVASYSGDANYEPSHGSVVQIVNPVPTAVKFITLPPCRVVDTRNPNGTFGGPAIPGHSSRSFPLSEGDNPCGIPADALAYSLNVTVVTTTGHLGYLTIWPTGEGQPIVSTMNSPDGRTKANAAIVPAGTPSGSVSVYVTDTTNVILDINGYFTTSGSSTLEFYPLPPCRIVDTRGPDGDLGGPYLHGQLERDFPIPASTCLPPGITPAAYSFNVTALPHPAHQHLGYLTVWATGEPQPVVSTLNNPTGTNVANAAIVVAGSNGKVAVYPSNDTDLLLDIDGYFATPGAGGLSLYTVTPCRVLDTRGVGSGQPFQGELTVNVTGSPCAPTSAAQAYVFNATVVPPGALGYLTLWPDGQSQPVVSTLNAGDGAITSNMAIVPNANGSIDAYASALTQLILDISGYFAP